MSDPAILMPDSFDPLFASVNHGAASIEQAFLAAGQGLGDGLDTFETISRDLVAFLGTIRGGPMADTTAVIGDLANRLVEISHALPRDAAVLDGLATDAGHIASDLDDLLEHIRMMTIIASSARIEAAVFREITGLDSFTAEMIAMTAAVKSTVSRCASDHAATTERIRRLHAVQVGLDHEFRERLLVLARELSEVFALISDRQERSRAMVEGLAGHSATIAREAGAALMALQSGDAARQRLEHVGMALRLATNIATGEPGAPATANSVGVVAALRALQAAQLMDLIGDFGTETSMIDGLLEQLGQEAGPLARGSRAVVSDDGGDGSSFLSTFKSRLADAAELVKTCERARHAASDAMVALRAEVGGLSCTITNLGATTRDLIVIGINAGLRAARLGPGGCSLMVIADELKRLAGLITAASSHLVKVYEGLVAGSHRLDVAERGERSMVVEQGILSTGAVLEVTDRNISGFVTALQNKAQRFDDEMSRVRSQFRSAVSTITALRDVASQLAEDGAVPPGGSTEGAVLGSLLWPHYTMAREREIHTALLGSIPSGASSPVEDESDDAFDTLLFA